MIDKSSSPLRRPVIEDVTARRFNEKVRFGADGNRKAEHRRIDFAQQARRIGPFLLPS
jgi:hypothetical protein